MEHPANPPEGRVGLGTDIALEADGLTKRFGDLVAVDRLSLAVRRGEIFGFLGPNGAGKTTSISMMCGLLKADAGRVLIGGAAVDSGTVDVRARVGVCPQKLVIWPELGCLEQLVFIGEMYGVPRQLARERGIALLGAMGLDDKISKLAKTLSGGMARRLNLVLALVHDPEILVLDEPEAGLDPQSRVLVRDFVRSLARKKTVVLTTHNMDEAERLADRVAIIDHGKLLELDTPDALKRKIGEGDVLEVTLEGDGNGNGDGGATAHAERALAVIKGRVPSATAAANILLLRAPNMALHLGGILETLRAAGFQCADVRLRQSTLEDVFIALTGRGLRA